MASVSHPLDVLAVGLHPTTFRRVRALIEAAAGRVGVTYTCVQRLPGGHARRFGLILVSNRAGGEGAGGGPGDPARYVLDLHDATASELWEAERLPPAKLLIVGNPAVEAESTAKLRRLFLLDPLEQALVEPIRAHFPAAQAGLLLDLMHYADCGTPARIAARMGISLRTLRRRCAALGLQPPQRLHLLFRVACAVLWMIRSRASLMAASAAAGYSEPSAFRRAAVAGFGVSPARLKRSWGGGDEWATPLVVRLECRNESRLQDAATAICPDLPWPGADSVLLDGSPAQRHSRQPVFSSSMED